MTHDTTTYAGSAPLHCVVGRIFNTMKYIFSFFIYYIWFLVPVKWHLKLPFKWMLPWVGYYAHHPPKAPIYLGFPECLEFEDFEPNTPIQRQDPS